MKGSDICAENSGVENKILEHYYPPCISGHGAF